MEKPAPPRLSHKGHKDTPASADALMHEGGVQTSSSAQMKDVVCGMTVTAQSVNKHEYAGQLPGMAGTRRHL